MTEGERNVETLQRLFCKLRRRVIRLLLILRFAFSTQRAQHENDLISRIRRCVLFFSFAVLDLPKD